jgi:hypothetical protein
MEGFSVSPIIVLKLEQGVKGTVSRASSTFARVVNRDEHLGLQPYP